MWCDQIWGFIKRHSTVPGAVVVFATTYVLVLAMSAGEAGAAWVQAVGSVAAILAAWIIPYRHELQREQRSRAAILDTVGALATRQAILYHQLVMAMTSKDDLFNWQAGRPREEWQIHKQVLADFPVESLLGFDISLLIVLREGADCGHALATSVIEWNSQEDRFQPSQNDPVALAEWHMRQVAGVGQMALTLRD